jgi:mannose-6-phosphate isomerase-like protein (cupin superfamily)
MRPSVVNLTAVLLAMCGAVCVPAQTNGIDRISSEQLAARGKALLGEAQKSPEGMALAIMQKSTGHFAELVARVKTGGAEMHDDWDDIFVILDGEATEVTGGTVLDPKNTGPGETRGSRVQGGSSTAIHKGDVVQVSAKTPHQMLVPAGKTVTYYVLKVQVSK